jgi:hypothetical protein
VDHQDWAEPLGDAGQVAVHEPVPPEQAVRLLGTAPDLEVALGRAELPGRALELVARGPARFARCAGETVAVLDLSGPPDPTGGFYRPVRILGEAGRATRRTDETRMSRLLGALRYLHLAVGDEVWVWHYAGGRTAGERLVLCPGDVPGAAALVTTHPSAHGRSLGNPTGGATADTHVTRWTARARPVDVLLAELLASSWLGALVDYRPARIAGGFTELLGSAPRPDANTE